MIFLAQIQKHLMCKKLQGGFQILVWQFAFVASNIFFYHAHIAADMMRIMGSLAHLVI